MHREADLHTDTVRAESEEGIWRRCGGDEEEMRRRCGGDVEEV